MKIGLKDKNGIHICQGDIIIKTKISHNCFFAKNKGMGHIFQVESALDVDNNSEALEVIGTTDKDGNIHIWDEYYKEFTLGSYIMKNTQQKD